MGGGLGGGSADAAIALRLLASLWKTGGDPADLAEIAAALGSDVPFFLTGGEANVTGRGEVVTPVEDSAPAELLLFVPPFPISTAGVYREHAGRFALPESLEIESPGPEKFLGPNDLASAVLVMEPRMEAYARVRRPHHPGPPHQRLGRDDRAPCAAPRGRRRAGDPSSGGASLSLSHAHASRVPTCNESQPQGRSS